MCICEKMCVNCRQQPLFGPLGNAEPLPPATWVHAKVCMTGRLQAVQGSNEDVLGPQSPSEGLEVGAGSVWVPPTISPEDQVCGLPKESWGLP